MGVLLEGGSRITYGFQLSGGALRYQEFRFTSFVELLQTYGTTTFAARPRFRFFWLNTFSQAM